MSAPAERRDTESPGDGGDSTGRSAARPTGVDDELPSDLELPTRFGGFLLFDKIGEGGMARIYLGRASSKLGAKRLVVVKQILPLLSNSPEFAKLFIDEAKLSAQLTHGNIAQVIDLGRERQTLYIAMEYVEGFDLRELLKHCSRSRTPLPIEFSLLIVIETLRALDYAHRKRSEEGKPLGIVHRDVSPSNILVSFEGEVKLCDFGIARAMGSGDDVPDEAIQGKAGYMSPEAASGGALDGRSDVFAAGIMLWELLAGKRLYRTAKGQAPSLDLARAAEIPPLPERGLRNETRLHEIVSSLLKKDRGERCPSAGAALRDLEEYAAEAQMIASPIRFGEWLMDHFGQEIVTLRRSREVAAKDELAKSDPINSPTSSPTNPALPVTRPGAYDDNPASGGEGSSPSSVGHGAPFEPAPPSLEAMVRPSIPEAPADKSGMVMVVMLLLAIAGAIAFYLTR